MAQPKWKLLYSTDYSSVWLDETDEYEAEMEIAQEYETQRDTTRFAVYRFSLDKLKAVRRDGKIYIVSDGWDESWPHPIHMYEEWFIKHLPGVASCVGSTERELKKALISDDINARAWAYESIGSCEGFDNLDGYPQDLSEEEFERRKDKE